MTWSAVRPEDFRSAVSCSVERFKTSNMRSVARLSGAAPWSNSGRASGCVFPRSVNRFAGSTACVTRAGTISLCCPLEIKVNEATNAHTNATRTPIALAFLMLPPMTRLVFSTV